MAYPSVRAENIYSPYLTQDEQTSYAGLMRNFMALCDAHNGSEQADDACVDSLILAESFLRSVLNDHPDNIYSTHEAEQLFYRQVLGQYLEHDETPPDYNELLGRVAAKFNARVLGLGQQQNLEELFEILEQGGAVIVRNPNSVFVKTDPSRSSINSNDNGTDIDVNKSAPKFAEVVKALQSIGIFANQMIIHPGTVDQNMVRTAPYHVIQIPELNCEIAVCDRIGEAIFVNSPLIGPHVFAMYDKEMLVGALNMKRVTYHGDWQTELLGHVLGDAPVNKKQRARVDTKKFAKDQSNKQTRLTPEMVMGVMLDYALAKHETTDQWMLPIKYTTGPVPRIEVNNWNTLNSSGERGERGLEKGMTLAFIQQSYGLKVEKRVNTEALKKAVQDWTEKGILPDKVEIKPLSVERVLIAMLEYADLQFHATGQWVLANQDTDAPVPGMKGEKWSTLNQSGERGRRNLEEGMTLFAIQQLYGFKVGQKFNVNALQRAVLDWKDKGILPQKLDIKPLSVERIFIAVLKYADQQFEATGQWVLPTKYTLDPVPGMEGENWDALSQNGEKGRRDLEKGMTLPAIQKLYGVKVGQKVNTEALKKAVQDWKETGQLPQRISEVNIVDVSLQPALI